MTPPWGNNIMTEGHKDGMTEGRKHRFALGLTVVKQYWPQIEKRFRDHKTTGPDLLEVVCADAQEATLRDAEGKILTGGLVKNLKLSFPVTFEPEAPLGFRCVIAGEVAVLDLGNITEDEWKRLADDMDRSNAALGYTVPPAPDRLTALQDFTSGRAEIIKVAGGYVRPIFGLSERKQDLPLLQEYYEPQTPLNWAVGLVMFSLTDEGRVKTGDWQEASVRDIEDRVFYLTERDAPRRGDHRTDIMAEIVKLATTQNYYYTIDTVRVGRAWMKRAVIGIQTAIPELQLIFTDTKTGKLVRPMDAAVRALMIPLEVKGRRIFKPNGKRIWSLPKGRFELDAIRWRWVQAFNDDLIRTPALEEKGKRIGLPKKTTTGKTIRKGYLVKVAGNILGGLHHLRDEGRGALYASRLLIMLAHNLHKTESGIAADRVFRMLGIPEDYAIAAHEKPEDLVARAIVRLMQPDIGALLPTSDTTPRTDPNQDRRKGAYYRLIRSPKYIPGSGIVSKEDALTIEAEYKDAPEQKAGAGPRVGDAILPGMEEPGAQPIPAGKDIRAAREAAGLNLRRFAEAMKGPSFKTWSLIETGRREKSGRIRSEVWQRVRAFIEKHGPKVGSEG